MRININFYCDNKFLLPIQYNHLVQSFIYNNINKKIANFLHEKGFELNKRNFKLFSFSRINGKIDVIKIKQEYLLLIKNFFNFILSSPYEEFITSFALNLSENNKKLLLGENIVQIYSIDVLFEPEFKENMKIKMLSPITIYSTLNDAIGNKKTYYYNPWEKEFEILVKENLIKKMIAFNNFNNLVDDINNPSMLKNSDYFENKNFFIKPHKVMKKDEKIINYKDTIIKAWFGEYLISGDIDLIKISYYCGLGSKNSQGFGLYEITN
ncbi:MAG: CRISPR-associated endoribonuclease Cas6 [Cyanobacteria bacterium]|nr:CRISPR-associated endoribonuclease Cas6 [Cyanobacteriota bacterium]